MKVPIKERLSVDALTTVIMNFDDGDIDGYNEMISALVGMASYTNAPKKLDFHLKNKATPQVKPFIKEPLVLELKVSHPTFTMLYWDSITL